MTLNPRQFGGGYTVDAPYDRPETAEAVHRVMARTDPGLHAGLNVWVTHYMNDYSHAGEYEHALHRIRIHPDVIEHPQGLMHEMGHRHSAIMGNAHAQYDTPERRQAEEDYAIRFADRHRP